MSTKPKTLKGMIDHLTLYRPSARDDCMVFAHCLGVLSLGEARPAARAVQRRCH